AETAARVAARAADEAAHALALIEAGPRAERIRAAEARLAAARAGLQALDAALANARIEAPFDGIITVRHREPGEAVGPGAAVLTLMNPAERWVRIFVPETRIGAVHLGQTAEITSDTYPGRRYEGRVTFISPDAEFTPQNVQTPEERVKLVYAVKVAVSGDPGLELKPGMPADVALHLEGGEDAARAGPAGRAAAPGAARP
ncbi:MAG: HlyD family efflux transporter periplasmic adaptor subunit, partial [Gemmatimonadetes bacterium]